MKKPNRYEESIANLTTLNLDEANVLLYASPKDHGVRLNFGRPGSRFAPKVLYNLLKKMPKLEGRKLALSEDENSVKDFLHQKKIIHLGGGHDHAFTLLTFLEKLKEKNILIINIDAHLDTRIDDIKHSGTPFRDFDSFTKKNVTLIQYGIHDYSNTSSTKTELSHIKQHIIPFHLIKKHSNHFTEFPYDLLSPFFIKEDTVVFISLDCDAIDSSIMRAVSAVNYEGFPLHHIRSLIELVQGTVNNPVLGIYEYNPVYDDLASTGGRAIASLMYDFISR